MSDLPDLSEPAAVEAWLASDNPPAHETHFPIGWFTAGQWVECACGYAPHDNEALYNHWAEHGITWRDEYGQLVWEPV